MATKTRLTPWLAKREGTGVWYAYWPREDHPKPGKLSLRTTDTREAEDRFAAFLIQKSRIIGVHDTESPDTLTVEMAFEDYLAEHVMLEGDEEEVVAKDTQQYSINNLAHFFNPMMIKDITIEDCKLYARMRRHEPGVQPIGNKSQNGTIRRELGVLRAAVNHEAVRKRITASAVPTIHRPKAPPPKDRWITKEEMSGLINAAARSNHKWASRTKLFIELAYYTAHRKSPLYALTWFQVDLKNLTIKLNADYDKVNKKLIERRQTDKKRPMIPIVPELAQILKEAKLEAQTEYVLGFPGSCDNSFNTLCDVCGLEDVTPHTMRHTRAVHLAQDGVGLYAIAGLLGDSITTVEKNYLHHCPDHLRDELAKSGRLPT